MKEVKAYIRHNMIGKVVEGLEHEGFHEMTLIDVRGLSGGLRSEEYHLSLELAEKYMNAVKLEIVCSDERVSQAVAIIAQAARTGRKGDGLIFITPVASVLRISTGSENEAALEPED